MTLSELRAGVFIAGTDTDVGKTVVACLIARAAAAMGKRVGVMKPVASGARSQGDRCVSADAKMLVAACGRPLALERVNPFCFEAPLAAPLAAELEGKQIDWKAILAGFRDLVQDSDFQVVEGAGGLLSPIAEGRTCLDLARALALPVWVVAPTRVGMVHQTSATLMAARSLGVIPSGFVVSEGARPHPHAAWDVDRIVEMTGIPCVGRIPRLAQTDPRLPGFPSGQAALEPFA